MGFKEESQGRTEGFPVCEHCSVAEASSYTAKAGCNESPGASSGLSCLKITRMTLEEESDLKRGVKVRFSHRGKALRLKTISLGFWVCQEACGSG